MTVSAYQMMPSRVSTAKLKELCCKDGFLRDENQSVTVFGILGHEISHTSFAWNIYGGRD